MYIYSHNPGSQGAKRLAQALGARRIKHTGSRFRGRGSPLVINWGASSLPAWAENVRLLNDPGAIQEASRKDLFFHRMTEADLSHLIPEYTNDRETAEDWLKQHDIVVRQVLTGHSGAGIQFVERRKDTRGALQQAPLYTKYIKKAREYRIHIFNGEIIDRQKKAKRNGVDANFKIRTHENGFVFARHNIDIPECVDTAALRAFNEATALNFGAFDVIWNRYQDRAWVLEVNTAPGLEGQTVESYANAIRQAGGR